MRGCQQCLNLWFVEKRNQISLIAFRWDCKNTFDQGSVFRMTKSGVPKKTMDCGKSGIAGSRVVFALFLKLVQECANQGSIEDFDIQIGKLTTLLLGGENQKQS
jgi:hypothetical protein